MTADEYLRQVVEPTLKDFATNPGSSRHAFLACVATFHVIDYVAGATRKPILRAEFRQESSAFAAVDRIAHGRDDKLFGNPQPAPIADQTMLKTSASTPAAADLQARNAGILDLAIDAVAFLRNKIHTQPKPSADSSKYTSFVVVPFDRTADGDVFPLPAQEVRSADVATRHARKLAASHAGAVAFSRAGDAATGEAEEAVVLAQFGDVDLERLRR